MKIRSLQELVDRANQMGGTLGAAAMALQVEQDRDDPIQMREKMRQALEVMRQSVESGMDPHTHSVSGLTGGQAARLMAVAESGESVGGTDLTRAAARALAVAEFNAAMGSWDRAGKITFFITLGIFALYLILAIAGVAAFGSIINDL